MNGNACGNINTCICMHGINMQVVTLGAGHLLDSILFIIGTRGRVVVCSGIVL